MICSIHQPNFLPWMGFFYKIFHSDVYVILDNVQYSKNSYINRNRIKTPSGPAWITVPVLSKGRFGQSIRETKINHTDSWATKMGKTFIANYKRAPHFETTFPKVEEALTAQWDSISQLNEELIRWILEEFAYSGHILKSSEMNLQGSSTDLLLSICRAVDADTYLSGSGGSKYQEEEKFSTSGIRT